MKLISFAELKPAKGITYGKVQIWRKEKRGEFPKRVRLGAARHGWIESEIDAWIEERARARDGGQ
jgi:prophage regulatory protein